VEKATVTVPLLAGFFGHGNAGDEMILQLLHGSPASPFLSGPHPRGGPAIPKFQLFRLLRSLRRSSALVLGGGELFQTRTSWKSLAYYLSLPLLARVVGRPFFGFSLSLDPDLGGGARWLTARVLRKAVGIWVRDETSRDSLERHGISVRLMPDIVWAWPVPFWKPPTALHRVLWVPRFLAKALGGESFGAALKSLSLDFDQGVLALHPEEDAPSLEGFRREGFPFQRVETWAVPGDVFERMAAYDLVVTMRYHGLIAAVLAGRPVIAIAGHGKVRALARELDVPIVEPGSVSSVDWRALCRRTFAEGPRSSGDRPLRAARALESLRRDLSALALQN
jgi:polysaccharide pyruvyl transferase CsaB